MNYRGSVWQMAAHLLTGATVAVALLSLVFPAAAQDKVWRLGLLSAGPQAQAPGTQSSWRSGILASLERNGFRVGSNLEVVDRYAGSNPARLPDLAREIIAANVDVVVAISDSAVRAMRNGGPGRSLRGRGSQNVARQRHTTNGIFTGDRQPTDRGIPGDGRAAYGHSPQRKPSDGQRPKSQAAQGYQAKRNSADAKTSEGNASAREQHSNRDVSHREPSRCDTAPIATGNDRPCSHVHEG